MGQACESGKNTPTARNLDISKAPEPVQKAASKVQSFPTSLKAAAPTSAADAKKALNGRGKAVVDAAKKGDVKGATSAAKKAVSNAVPGGGTNGKSAQSQKKTQQQQLTLPTDLKQGLTPKERSEAIKAKFRAFDTDGDKLLSKDEFMQLWPEYGINTRDGAEVFAQIDKTNSGTISLAEFDMFYVEENVAMILKEFRNMDNDGDRFISQKEFLTACNTRYLCPVSRSKRLFKQLDTNKDGKLSFKEFRDGLSNSIVLKTLYEILPVPGKALQKPDPTYTKESLRKSPPKKDKPSELTQFYIEVQNGKPQLRKGVSIMKAFNQVDWRTDDQNHHGRSDRQITQAEWVEYFGKQNVSASEAKKLFRLFDENNSKKISFKEFNEYFQANGRPRNPRRQNFRRQRSRGNLKRQGSRRQQAGAN